MSARSDEYIPATAGFTPDVADVEDAFGTRTHVVTESIAVMPSMDEVN